MICRNDRATRRRCAGRISGNVGGPTRPSERRHVVRPRHPGAGLYRGTVHPFLTPARIPALENPPLQEVAAEWHLRPRIPVRDRGRGVPAPNSLRVSDRSTDLGTAPTRSRPIAASSCPASESSSPATSPSRSSTSSRSTGGRGAVINLLNAFINLHFDDRFEVRFGRFFTPLTYDQYAISNYWLPTPERSVFTTNVGLSRQFGLMAWGYLFDKRLDYAAGVFNGSRNSFESLNSGVDFVALP